MLSDQTFELRVQCVDVAGRTAFETKEAVKDWLVQRGETSFVESEVEGDAPDELETSCHPLLLYSFDREALSSLRRDLETNFGDAITCSERQFANEEWQREWQQDFQPIATARFRIVAPWQAAHDSERIVLTIHPGMAFGDAQHETTQLCLRVLENIPLPEPGSRRLLDVGTGTGILAIAAKKLGWDEVVATDIAADAILAAQENAAANGVEATWHRGSFPPDEERFGAVVANIFGHILRGMAQDLVARLRPGGWLVLSGVIEEERAEMLACFRALGLEEAECEVNNGWMAMVMRL